MRSTSPGPKKPPPLPQRKCIWCGEKFQPKRDRGKFCSTKCRSADYNFENPRTPKKRRMSNEPEEMEEGN